MLTDLGYQAASRDRAKMANKRPKQKGLERAFAQAHEMQVTRCVQFNDKLYYIFTRQDGAEQRLTASGVATARLDVKQLVQAYTAWHQETYGMPIANKYRQQSADMCTQGYSKNPWRRGLEVSVWHVSSAPESKYIVSDCCVSAQKSNQVPSQRRSTKGHVVGSRLKSQVATSSQRVMKCRCIEASRVRCHAGLSSSGLFTYHI